jgi:hypothetical protein
MSFPVPLPLLYRQEVVTVDVCSLRHENCCEEKIFQLLVSVRGAMTIALPTGRFSS